MPRGRQKGCAPVPKPERSVVQINDNYRVVIDKYNLILQHYAPGLKTENEEDKDCKDGWKFLGYYTNWDAVFYKLLRVKTCKHIDKKKRIEIAELRRLFLDIKDDIKKMTDGIKVKYNESK